MTNSVKLTWRGKDYIIAESDVFEVAGEIEEVVTLADLAAMAQSPKFVKLSKAYAVMLKYAGAKNVTAQQVHSEIMAGIKGKGDAEIKEVLFSAIEALMHILMDGAPMDVQGDDGGKQKAGGS